MPTPIDISSASGPQQQRPAPETPRGTGLPVDDFARTVAWLSGFASLFLFGFLLIGLLFGSWPNPAFNGLDHLSRLKQISNIGFIFELLEFAAVVLVISMLICNLRDEGLGYALLIVAAICYLGIPALTNLVYGWRAFLPSRASTTVLQDMQGLAWVFAIPGILWTLGDLFRRFQAAAEAAAIQRVNMRYGQDVKKQEHKTKFLGKCWELPYCREQVKVKCPIYLRGKGPCWRYKEGCMCEEKIVLQAVIASDWKQQAARAVPGINMTPSMKPALNDEQKRERCRNCIIYNEHERQKYKALSVLATVGIPGLAILFVPTLQAQVVAEISALIDRFSFGPQSIVSTSSSDLISWIVVVCGVIVLLAQVLKFIEYCCFKIKI